MARRHFGSNHLGRKSSLETMARWRGEDNWKGEHPWPCTSGKKRAPSQPLCAPGSARDRHVAKLRPSTHTNHVPKALGVADTGHLPAPRHSAADPCEREEEGETAGHPGELPDQHGGLSSIAVPMRIAVCGACASQTWRKCPGCQTALLCARCQAEDLPCFMCMLIDERGMRRVYGASPSTPATSSQALPGGREGAATDVHENHNVQ